MGKVKKTPASSGLESGRSSVAKISRTNSISKRNQRLLNGGQSPNVANTMAAMVRGNCHGNKNKNTEKDRPIRVYADGVFDMYHIGHARVLEQAKKLFPNTYLIVGVSGDEETIGKKGKIVMSQQERCDILKHCKWVDEVLCPCPWVITLDFLQKNNIDYVAHDDAPYGSAGAEDIYAEIKKAGKFKATQRTDGISTSDIILRVIQDYDMYVQRSMQRGYNRKQIGVSWSKFQRMKWYTKLNKYAEKYENQFKGSIQSFKSGVDNSPMVKRIKSHFKQLLGVEDSKSKMGGNCTDEEESDFDA